ncbi:hypothetical protein F8388_015152 [Cannabis sativa]|uniref:Uncharacterized protein n=1 Tax=Cannabis sativa TaxID=3483 RepID=A0A7J6ET24_CANSA|nr:hypothetical protein F8388_015152 [Cannabis sativa]KAF4395403.1 hypothetical protein G4B88_010867 [Cannabis sativa]
MSADSVFDLVVIGAPLKKLCQAVIFCCMILIGFLHRLFNLVSMRLRPKRTWSAIGCSSIECFGDFYQFSTIFLFLRGGLT